MLAPTVYAINIPTEVFCIDHSVHMGHAVPLLLQQIRPHLLLCCHHEVSRHRGEEEERIHH